MSVEEFPLGAPVLQGFVARSSVRAQDLRNMGIDRNKICNFLADCDLQKIRTNGVSATLCGWMKDFHKVQGNSPWGPVRKAMNLFLRGCSYNYWLRQGYELHKIEADLEIPLDSQTMEHLRAVAPKAKLTRSTVSALNSCLSDRYQNAAQEYAKLKGVSRIHLDVLWWNSPKLQHD